MERRKSTKGLIRAVFYLFISGLSLGWLVGLSVSPVIQTILTSLIAVVISIATALAGLHSTDIPDNFDEPAVKNSPHVRINRWLIDLFDPLPVMVMVVGLSFGASLGVYGRANNWLGARSNPYVQEWRETGLSSKEITTRVFDLLYPPGPCKAAAEGFDGKQQPSNSFQQTSNQNTTKSEPDKETKAGSQSANELSDENRSSFRAGVLFSATLYECKRLLNSDDEDELRREMASSAEPTLINLARACKNVECLKAAVNKACAKYR